MHLVSGVLIGGGFVLLASAWKALHAATTGPRARRRPRDWIPMGLTLCVWLCTLPLVFLLIAPWFGVRAAVATAVALLLIMAVVCQMLCSWRRLPRQS
jgi:hypothetical protein